DPAAAAPGRRVRGTVRRVGSMRRSPEPGETLGEHWVMRRKLVAVVLGGTIAGAASALVALATFTDHGATADGAQPSTLLASASGSGGANLATAPSWPGQTGGGSQGGGSGTAAGRTQ